MILDKKSMHSKYIARPNFLILSSNLSHSSSIKDVKIRWKVEVLQKKIVIKILAWNDVKRFFVVILFMVSFLAKE